MYPGSVPLMASYFGMPTNLTIAASMGGTAAATALISSATFSYARSVEVFNLTGRNLELIIAQADPGSAAAATPFNVSYSVFCPGTASAVPGGGRGLAHQLAITAGTKIWARTTENTPITCASTTPLVLNFWA